ncbi:hypothetical protein AH04_197 [Erwinia phage AH04]|uniref:Uncharacterized protein n=1 Tax=Erwinia phage AH04 TaxID=2869569 RepID=A0AAE7X0Q9_9CAUD|nr:hypothetical protein PQC02_gp117 [Erwinia phage AH04]QZA70672.1 hypothetical protein AH04_197 [Erwinia phage AH04]
MAELVKVNKKVINDPLYTPVIKFLKDRIASLEITGPEDELALSKQRYDGLVAGDLVIESAVTFPDGVVRVCIVSRKTGFARVDIDIKYVQMDDILTDFAIPLVEINDVDQLKAYVKALQAPVEPTLLYLKDEDTYGVLVTQEQAETHEGPMQAFGNLFFEKYVTERESLNSINWETLECGTVTITDPSFGRGVYPLFIYELVLSEAQLPEITSNLPASITSRRGETFTIPNTYLFAGSQDITTVATVELSTQSGYAILERSTDLLDIDGETIYGSATAEINDQIVVRVTYDWNGRLVHKNFYIDLKIEKDLPNDLTVVSVPSDVTATNGDTIQVTLTASYKGAVVEILIPPTALKSSTGRSNLQYVKTNRDFSMVYQGTVNANFGNTVDKISDLASGVFNYNDNGTIVKATGFVNIIIVKPETLPAFNVTGVPTLLQGYIDATGSYKPVVTYGDQVIPLTDLSIATGPQGSKQLVDITSVDSTTVSWELINDSQIPGTSARDTFTQVYQWLDPRGVLQTKSFVVQVEVKLDSIVRIVPMPPQPRTVNRYQTGGPTWYLEVNGENSNGLIRSVTVDPIANVDQQYIVNRPEVPNQWFVKQASETQDINYTANFTFTAQVDGVVKTYKFAQDFVIAKYVPGQTNPDLPVNDDDPANPGGGPAPGETGTGPGGPDGPTDPSAPGGENNPDSPGEGDGPYNTNLVAVPTSFTIAGNSDKDYQLTFKVFKGADDVTADSELMSDFIVQPEFITFKNMSYDAAKNQYQITYTKNKGGVSEGCIFSKLKADATPAKTDIARLWLNVNIVQIKILKAIDAPTLIDLDVDKPKDLPLNIEFSGTKLSLNDPNLVITKTGTGTAKITNIGSESLTFINDVWTYVGRSLAENSPLRLQYTDPADGKQYNLSLPFTVRTTFPPMEVLYTASQTIDAKIWDKNTFPLKLMAGDKDWTSALSQTLVVSGNKYVSVNKLNWEVIFAETTATSKIVGLNLYYSVGLSTGQMLPADFKFNLAAWDGVTFIADSHTPDKIDAASGTSGEITATFLYKGNVGTDKVALDVSKSTIPATVVLGTPAYDSGRALYVIPYTLTKGGNGTMKLVFGVSGDVTNTTSISIDTKVAWPDDLNIITQGDNIRGFYEDTVDYPLTLNVAGTPVDLTDANMEITTTVDVADAITLEDTLAGSLKFLLAKGGTVGTSYNYTVSIGIKYTDQVSGKVYTKTLTVPATIRVPSVSVGNNPTITASVFDRGAIPITLIDERGRTVTITSYKVAPAGGTNVTMTAKQEWYVTNGSTAGTAVGQLPLLLGYSMGGADYEIDVLEKFTINRWDGTYFRVTTNQTKIDGQAGIPANINLLALYVGYPSPDMTIDATRSTVPSNISIGDLVPVYNADGSLASYQLPYTLAGQAVSNMKLCYVRGGTPSDVSMQKEGTDFVYIEFTVTSQSSNEPFTLVSYDDAVSVDWGKTATIKVQLKYGDYDLPPNSPGVKYALANADVHGITITGTSKDGIIVKGTRSDIAGSTKVYPETINITYEVGAPQPKTATFNTSAAVSMGPVAVINNDNVAVTIWSLGSFRQAIQFNGVTLSTIDHFDLRDGAKNKYIEVTPPRGYEIIGAEPTTTTQSIPMTAYYKVDGTDALQTVNFDASFRITGSSSVRFKVTASPTSIEGSLGNDTVLTCSPIYKDKPAGANATFKPDLSTIPAELTLKDYKVVNNNYVITFTGAKAGVDKMTLVFWSPDAGTTPDPRDVASVDVNVQVMGELGLEIGNRDNLLTGGNTDTGVYNLQILFGGIPIDNAAEIAAGNLTATREVGAASSTNANVLQLSSWNASSFNYTLAGIVAPNQSVNVSDFINLVYKYGGSNYSRRVEIPLVYTSPAPDFSGWPTAELQVFSKGGLSPTVMCGGVNISSGVTSISNYGETDDKYVTLGGPAKTYEIIYGETTQTTHAVPGRVIGQYRSWPWSALVDINFTIAAWNQKTWYPQITPASWDTYLDLTGKASVGLILKGTYKNSAAVLGTTSLYDPSRTDLKGLVSITGFSVSGGNMQQNFTLNALAKGNDTARICWKWKDGVTPGVENVDYGFTDLPLNIKENSLVGVSAAGVTGGDGDTVTGALVVRLLSTNTQIVNTNTALVIKVVDEKVMKITSLAGSTITVQITAPFTTADGPTTVPMTFTYTDPTTGYVTKGTFDYPVTLKRPADWPVVTQSAPTNTLGYLWTYGPNPFKVVTGGVDVTAQAVPTSCVDDMVGSGDPVTSNYMQLSLDNPVAGTWWWITNKNYSSSQQSRTTKWKLNVPYRGSTVSVDGNFIYIRPGDGANPTPEFQGSTSIAKNLMQDVGDQAELPFTLLWRNYKYSKGVFKPELSGNGTQKFADYFKVVSQRYDDTTGITYLKIEMTQVYQGSMIFVWDKADASASPTIGVDRVSVSTSFYDLTVTDLGSNSWTMWGRQRLGAMVSIKDGDTELVTASRVASLSNDLFRVISTDTNPTIQLYSDTAIPAQSFNLTVGIALPAAYNGRIIKVILPVTLAAYDGNELTWSLTNFSATPVAVAPSPSKSFFFGMTFRGQNVPYNQRSSSTALLRSVNNNTGMMFGTIDFVTPSNWVYYSFGSTIQQVGVKLPVNFIGAGYDQWPAGTLGKNYLEIDVPNAVIYQNALFLYPGDTEPATATGQFGSVLSAPVKFSVGKDVAQNVIAANAGGMAWTLSNAAALSGVLSKPTTNFATATGINFQVDYDNRGDDITVDATVAMKCTATLNSVAVNSTRTYNQKVVIKGTKAGDTIVTTPTAVSGKVWDVGGPAFTITQNGKAIPTSSIKSVTIKDNPYVRRPETTPGTTTRWWEIYNNINASTVAQIEFTVVYTDGVRDHTVVQAVQFTIAAYNGIDLVIALSNLATFNNGITGQVSTGTTANNTTALTVNGSYRGVALDVNTLNKTFGVWTSKSNFPGCTSGTPKTVTVTLTSGVYYYAAFFPTGLTDMDVSQNGTLYFGLLSKENDATAVEGKDYVKVTVPSYVYLPDRFYVISNDATLSGSYGDGTSAGTTIRLNYRIRRGLDLIQNNVGGNTTTGAAITDPNILGVGYASNVGFEPVWFLKELTSTPQKTTRVKFTVNPLGGVVNQSSFFVDVTQISNLTFPTVSGLQTVEANLNQSGGLPFKLTDDAGTDITSQATITAVSSNDYIKLQNGKWYCYNARTGDTNTTVTISYAITYKGNNLVVDQNVNYLVKGYTGQPTVSNVQVVSGKLNDTSSTLPFIINVSGNPVPSNWIISIAGTAANNRVKVGPGLNNAWTIIASDNYKTLSDTVSYQVTVNNGYSTWTVNQDVVFSIQPNEETQPVSATGSMTPITYGETGQVILTGKVGDDTLAGNVTFVPGSSDAKGLVTFGAPTTGDNGTVVIPVTGTKVGKDNLTIHITVNGATGNVSGKDYLDIIVPAEVNYASMEESEDFETSGTGYQNTPVTLTQSVILPTDE